MLAGLLLRGEDCRNSIFVLDGDVYRTEEEQKERLNAVLTGDDQVAKSLREAGLEKIKCLNLPEDSRTGRYIKPEKYIHSIIIGLGSSGDNEYNEIIEVAKQIVVVDDSHKYVNEIINRLDWDKKSGLSKVVDLVSSTQEWLNYTADVRNWLSSKLELVQEVESQNE